MKATDLKQLDTDALMRLLGEQQEKLRELRFKVGQGELKNVREMRATKTLIAQIKTLHTSRTKTNL